MAPVLCLPVAAKAYTLFGIGTQSCGKVVQNLDLDGQNSQGSFHVDYANWLTGYLSGANAWSGEHDIGGRSDPAAWTLWIKNYCVSNPISDLGDAAIRLREALKLRTP